MIRASSDDVISPNVFIELKFAAGTLNRVLLVILNDPHEVQVAGLPELETLVKAPGPPARIQDRVGCFAASFRMYPARAD
jgi:hypothetical protein